MYKTETYYHCENVHFMVHNPHVTSNENTFIVHQSTVVKQLNLIFKHFRHIEFYFFKESLILTIPFIFRADIGLDPS